MFDSSDGFTAYLLISPSRKKFLCRFDDARGARQTADYYFDALSSLVKDYKCTAVVSDAAAVNIAAVKRLKVPHVPCFAHFLSNLLKCLLDKSSGVLTVWKFFLLECVGVARFFKNRRIFQFNLARQIKLPAEVRFGSSFLCLESLVFNEKQILAVVSSRDFLSSGASLLERQKIHKFFTDSSFLKKLNILHSFTKEIFNLIQEFQNDSKPCSLVIPAIRRLKFFFSSFENFSVDERRLAVEVLETRSARFLSFIHYASHYLDARFIGEAMSVSEREKTKKDILAYFSKDNDDEIAAEIQEFEVFYFLFSSLPRGWRKLGGTLFSACLTETHLPGGPLTETSRI